MSDALRVLIADDEPLIRMDLKELLEAQGYEVIAEAKDGQQAVDMAKELEPDLVFLDIRMPNMDGLDAAEAINDHFDRRVPIIMLTAYSQAELYERASEIGVYAYLTKPLRESDLAPAVEVAISRACDMQDLLDEIEEANEKLEVRKLVEKAKGVLMKKLDLDEETAMKNLQRAAMTKRTSIKEVAESILERK